MIGRLRELQLAERLLREGTPLLTLWGPPGIGKTTLAKAICAAHPARSPVRASLASVAGIEGLITAVAGALSAREPDLAPAKLAGRILLLDNIEHIAETHPCELTETLGRWLEEAPGLQILATSRVLLRSPDERALALEPLGEEDALLMFLSQVDRHRPGLQPDPADHPLLRELVAALDGIPLAIELAAARWELLGARGLLDRLSEPLRILARPRADDPRHVTLRAAIAWSWALLGAAEQEALCACAMFARRFDLSAAEALVGQDALDLLDALRDSALLQVPVPGRFSLLSSVRAFALEQISAERRAALSRAHARWCLERAEDPDRIAPDLREDLCVAVRTLLDGEDPRAADLLLALGSISPGRHLDLLDEAVERLQTAGALRARGRALRLRGAQDASSADFTLALQRAPDLRAKGVLLREIGVNCHAARQMEEARACYERALEAHRASGDARSEAITIGNIGALDHDACRYEDAEIRYEEALRGLRAAGDRRTEAIFLANQAVLRQEQGLLAAAEVAYERALGIQEQEGDERMVAITLGNLGLLLHELGRVEDAIARHEEAARRFRDVTDPASFALCLARLAAARAALGQDAAAASAHAEATRLASDPLTIGVVKLFGAFLLQSCDPARADEIIEGAAPLAALSGDARVALRLLRTSADEIALTAGEDWFVLQGKDRQDLSKHASCRRMFHALLLAREQRAGEPMSVEDLFEAGWPGEHISPESARNRVHVNLARLRGMGLKDLLVRTEQGYHLSAGVSVIRSA